MEILETFELDSWPGPFPAEVAARAVGALEAGAILYAPGLHFELSDGERRFLSPECLDDKSKNVSFRPGTGALRGSSCKGTEKDALVLMLRRYYTQARALVAALCPPYRDKLTDGFTSFRPAEIAGRVSSWRKDDTRLHVDAFPSRPVQGRRILRVFSNVNAQAARVWRLGEAFARVAARFFPQIRAPLPGSSWLLYRLRIVKGRRAPYDHFMLGIHDRMKADARYQSEVSQTELAFPPGATWACFTDAVSHAAMSG